MTEDTYVQLFWAIALPTGICLMLVLGGAVHYLLEDPAMRHLRKMIAARQTWAKMLGGESNERQ